MQGPLVSIVLPTHNRADLLPEAIDSILAQKMRHWELVAVDDASTDATPEMLAAYAAREPRIRVLRNESNLRLPLSLNRGFAEARAPFLTWTSDDNLYHEDALLAMTRSLEENPGIGLVYASMRVIDAEGTATGVWQARPAESQPVQPWVGACFLYRREVRDEVGEYDPEMVLAEDLDYWIRIRLRFPMLALPNELYDYREHPQSLSSRQARAVAEAGARVVEKHWDRIDWLTPENRARTLLGLAKASLERGDRNRSRSLIREAAAADRKVVLRDFKRDTVRAFLGL